MMQVSDLGYDILVCDDKLANKINKLEPAIPLVMRYPNICFLDIQGKAENIFQRLLHFGVDLSPKLMDRFFICRQVDSAKRQRLLESFFDVIAPIYEQLVDIQRNYENIQNLMEAAKSYINVSKCCTVIDFGCGIGLSHDVMAQYEMMIVGLDPCPGMRGLAKRRGMRVWGPAELARQPMESIDAAFASYVFHLLPDSGLLRLLWNRLKVGGVITANFHKQEGLVVFETTMNELGGVRMKAVPLRDDTHHGAYRVFAKRI